MNETINQNYLKTLKTRMNVRYFNSRIAFFGAQQRHQPTTGGACPRVAESLSQTPLIHTFLVGQHIQLPLRIFIS